MYYLLSNGWRAVDSSPCPLWVHDNLNTAIGMVWRIDDAILRQAIINAKKIISERSGK